MPEDPEKLWIFFAPGKIPRKTLKLQPTPEKSCSGAGFPCINFWPCSAVTFSIPVTQRRRIYDVIGGKTAFVVWQAAYFSSNGHKPSSKRRIKRGWVQAEDLRMIIMLSKT